MSGSTLAPFDIGRSTGVCAATGQPLAPGDRTVAVLVEDVQTGTMQRLDFAEGSWCDTARPVGLFCFWRRVVPDSNAKPTPFIDDDELVALFEGLDGAEGANQQALRFILALLLVRKRLFRHMGREDRAGGRVMLLKRRGAEKDEPPIAVDDPGMDGQAVAAATEHLGQALRGEE